MFDFGWGELVVIAVAALIFIGPKELPGVLRTAGQWMAKVRRMAAEFQNQFQDAMREAELADLKKEVDAMASQAANYAKFDPLDDIRKDMESAEREIESALANPAPEENPQRTATTPPLSSSPPEVAAELSPGVAAEEAAGGTLSRPTDVAAERKPGGSEAG